MDIVDMDILFIAGMIDRKLESKILPLQESKKINRIFLVRKNKYNGKKINNYNISNKIKKNYFISELIRVFQIIFIIAKYKPTYIIAAGLIPHGIYGIIFSKISGIKSILLIMGELELPLINPQKNIKQKLLLSIAKKSDIIGVRGSNSYRKIKELGYNKKLFIHYNTFSFKDFYPLGLPKEYDLVFIGNLKHEKRLDILIDIIKKIKLEKGLDIRAIIVGSCKLKSKLKNQVFKLRLQDNINFMPFQEKEELNILINKSKILILTSEYEGLPMVVIESFACGTPVIAFDIADISDIVRDNINGYLIDFNNKELFVEKIFQLLTNNKLYEKFVKNCYNFRDSYREIYSVPYITKIWDNILKNG